MKALRLVVVSAVLLVASTALAFDTIELKDPKGDDKGPGTYTYPTHQVYVKQAFDITGFKVEDDGDDVKITVDVAGRIEDPWDSKAWRGKGWSVQMFAIHIDTDHKPKSGHEKALPGFNVRFQDDSWWDKVVLISPQPDSRIKTEVEGKATDLAKDVVLPRKVTVRGKSFVAIVSKKDLGIPEKTWGWQVLAQSNEGFPDKGEVLTRKVNEFNGEHRFGGGTDYDCDPHVMDILVSPAKGDAGEADAQYKAMSYKCDAANPEGIDGQARLPMVYLP